MKSIHLPILFLLLLPGQADQEKAAAPVNPSLSELAWLAGSWSGTAWGSRFEAWYSTPEGGKILGVSELFRDGEVVFHEFERFETAAGKVILIPYPRGREAERFELVRHDGTARRAVFENGKKDFPTRIVYERTSEEGLLIVLSDPFGGSDKVERFVFRRVSGTPPKKEEARDR